MSTLRFAMDPMWRDVNCMAPSQPESVLRKGRCTAWKGGGLRLFSTLSTAARFSAAAFRAAARSSALSTASRFLALRFAHSKACILCHAGVWRLGVVGAAASHGARLNEEHFREPGVGFLVAPLISLTVGFTGSLGGGAGTCLGAPLDATGDCRGGGGCRCAGLPRGGGGDLGGGFDRGGGTCGGFVDFLGEHRYRGTRLAFAASPAANIPKEPSMTSLW